MAEPSALRRISAPVGLLLACYCAALIPLLTVRFPPIMDYPNHLARIWLLGGGASANHLTETYIVDWSRASTNVAVDWVASQLAGGISLGAADLALRVVMFLAPAIGATCLAAKIAPKLSSWHVLPLALVWGTTSIAGFLSYNISIGAALIAAWSFARLDCADVRIRGVVHLLSAWALLTIHPFGYFFYLALSSGLVLGSSSGGSLKRLVITRFPQVLAYLAIAALPLLLLAFLSKSPPGTGTHFDTVAAMLNPARAAKTFLSPILSYNAWVDLTLLAPLVLVLLAQRRGTVQVHFGLAAATIGLAVGALIAPNQIGDASWITRRLPLMVALTACVAIQPDIDSSRYRTLLRSALAFVVLGKIAWIAVVWDERASDASDLLQATTQVHAGDTVLVTYGLVDTPSHAPIGRYMIGSPGGTRPVRRHLGSMLVPLKGAIVPSLFAIKGQHPLRVGGKRLGMTSAEIPTFSTLAKTGYLPPHLQHWQCKFDYVLLLGADEIDEAVPRIPGLQTVSEAGFASLYAISPAAVAAAGCPPPLDPAASTFTREPSQRN